MSNYYAKVKENPFVGTDASTPLLNELRKRDRMRGLSGILSLFPNEVNRFNNTRARMLDSIYHMTLL